MSEEYKRFTISLPKSLYEDFEAFRKKLDVSRSDAVRKAMFSFISTQENIPKTPGDVVGTISMIMSHEHFDDIHEHTDSDTHEHDFSSRPVYASLKKSDELLKNDLEHHYLDIIISTMHIHLQYEKCVEIIAVNGPYDRVKELKESLERLKSVYHVGLFIIDKEINPKEIK
jgi:CopG family nickel-responsive transcriptional regulator